MSWTLIEPDIYLIAACLPTYRPLLIYMLSKSQNTLTSVSKRIYGSKDFKDPSQAPQSLVLEEHANNSAGYQQFGDGSESLDGSSYGDHVRLVNLRRENLERQGQQDIRVQNDFDVTVSFEGKSR